MNILGCRFVAVITAVLALAAPALAQDVATERNRIESLDVVNQGSQIVLRIGMSKEMKTPPAGFSVANPARIALDFPQTTNALGSNRQTVNEGDLRSISLAQVGDRIRMVLNLVKPLSYQSRIEGNTLFVTLEPKLEQDPVAARGTQFSPSVSADSSEIRDIIFRRGREGEGRIIVDLSDPSTSVDVRQQGRDLIVEFMRTGLPDSLRRRLDVNDFATPVTSVTASSQAGNARLVISPKGLWEHNAYQSNNQFIVEVKPIIEDPNKLTQGTKIGYQGPRVSINYQNGDIRALLRLMAEELGFNAVISETVTGTATLVLKDVPADQVMDILFQQKGLDMRKNGNVIMIAPREEIATREKLDYEARKQISELEPLVTESFQLNYQKGEAVKKLLTDSDQRILSKRGSVVFDPRTNIVFVQDTADRLEEARRLIAKIDISVRQVLIEARIVEASDTFSRDLGIRLGIQDFEGALVGHRILGSDSVRYGIGGTASSLGYQTGQEPNLRPAYLDTFNVNLPANVGSGGTASTFAFSIFNSAKTLFLNTEISAAEADGTSKVISSPRVVTADQVEAVIKQGTQVPYRDATSSGATSTSFKDAVLSLKVKPAITPDGRVILSVEVNKDQPVWLSSENTGAPAIDTKQVKTEVLVDNGGTVVIGGIYTQETSDNTSKVPFLGDVPVLGFFFKSNSKKDTKKELLIFITPKIITDSLTLR